MSIIAEQSMNLRTMADLATKVRGGRRRHVRGYGAAVWDTPDGKHPSAADLQNQSKAPMLERPVSIDLQTSIRPAGPGGVQATVRGGQLAVTASRSPTTTPRTSSSAVGISSSCSPLDDINGNLSRVPSVLDAWPVGGDDLVQTPHEGKRFHLRGRGRDGRVPSTWPTPTS